MKAIESSVLPFLKKADQLVVPIYQRNYSWSREECWQLWSDILRAGSRADVAAHFIGSVVYISKGVFRAAALNPLLLIDGQQRMTTITLLLAALAEVMEAGGAEIEGLSAVKVRQQYLLNPLEAGDARYKLILSETDKDALVQVLGGPPTLERSVRIRDNMAFFRESLRNPGLDLAAVVRGLLKLVVVDVSLEAGLDNPQLIFESLNSTGRRLSQADLIRNFILMGLEPAEQTRLYEHYWRPMEVGFGQEAYAQEFDGFVRHYLSLKTGVIPNIDNVYAAFKDYALGLGASGMEPMLEDLKEYSDYYRAMALSAERNRDLARAFADLRDLRVEVAYPFLLELYRDHAVGKLGEADFLEALRLVESYVFRRSACAIPSNSLNKTFLVLYRSLDRERLLESLKAQLALLGTYKRFPDDEEFKRELATRNLYHHRHRRYWPRRLETHGKKELVDMSEYSLEHIMPQNDHLSRQWRAELGPDWKRVRETWLHTLGNLTLTGYNSEYSDKPFAKKRDMRGGFKESPLTLNKGLGSVERWDEDAIKRRASLLAERAVEVWPAPDVSAEVLERYRPKPEEGTYTAADHPNLSIEPTRSLFEAFRQEVMAMDPGVTETFLKYYVAYKAETNFVDVVPQAKGLLLILNMAYDDLADPRRLAKDARGVGSLGTGEVQARLRNAEDLQYVLYLVRQALDKQVEADTA